MVFFIHPIRFTSPMRFTFPKAEHLCLQREINALFASTSRSLVAYPLRALLHIVPHEGNGPQAKVLISVSKRKFKRAVDRNRAKRQIREAYRLQKHTLIEQLPDGVGCHLAFIWIADQPCDSNLVHKRMGNLLQRLAEQIAAAQPSSLETP